MSPPLTSVSGFTSSGFTSLSLISIIDEENNEKRLQRFATSIYLQPFFFGFLAQIPYCARHWIMFECPLIIFTINYDLFIPCVVFVERIVQLQNEFTNVEYIEGVKTLQTKLLNGNKTLILKSPWKSYFSINSI